jgi:hypothetical protein
VLSTTGRRAFAVHRERAQGMLLEGSAVYESAGRIRLTATVRTTSEMAMGPIAKHGPRVRRADSSHGDSGRGLVGVRKTLHIHIGRSNAGL